MSELRLLLRSQDLKTLFDNLAVNYDVQWARMAPVHHGLHFLINSILSHLPHDAHILCVGAGTGAEIEYLATMQLEWEITAVKPSGAMLGMCRKRSIASGFSSTVQFYQSGLMHAWYSRR